jgi:hypothetical protein
MAQFSMRITVRSMRAKAIDDRTAILGRFCDLRWEIRSRDAPPAKPGRPHPRATAAR